jgi:hypothetical protein
MPEQVGPRTSSTVQASHVFFHQIPSRHQKWQTIAIHLVGGHLELIHRASGSPAVLAAATVEAALDLKEEAQTCVFFRSGTTGLGLGCPL